jgi:hypothetical protein
VISRPPRLTDEETLSLMKLALAHWGIRTRSCAEFFDYVEKEFIRVLGRPFATTRKKVHRAMKEFRDNGTVLGESVNGARSDSPLTIELRRVMQALTDAAAEEVGFNGRKGTVAKRALEQYEDMWTKKVPSPASLILAVGMTWTRPARTMPMLVTSE